jgi:cell division protein FtsB
MEERKRNVKVVVRPSTPLLKIIVIVFILFGMAALAALSWVRTSILNRTEDLRAEAAGLEYENQALTEKIGELGGVQSVQDIAEGELGYIDPNTVLITPTS